MIEKPLTRPLRLLKLEACLRRISKSHPKRQAIESDYAKCLAGFKGEQSLQYYLSFLPAHFAIFHDLRLGDEQGRFFQMDLVIVTPYFILVIEVKNYAGNLLFDQINKQLIRTSNGMDEGFPDPITQVKHQCFQLKSWLTHYKSISQPIIPLVVTTNPYSIIKFHPEDTNKRKKAIRSDSLLDQINIWLDYYPKEIFSQKGLSCISTLFLKHHTNANTEILQLYNIPKSEITKGVHCPVCHNIPIGNKKGVWFCSDCSYSSKDAFLYSLHDYAVLYKQSVRNEDVRQFLMIKSASVTRKLLTSVQFPYSGVAKNRKYSIPFPK